MVLKSPIKEQRLIWRPKYLQPLHLDILVLEVYAVLLQFLKLCLCIQLLMRVPLRFMLEGIVVYIIDEVVVASNNNFMLVREGIKKGNKAVEFSPVTILSEIPSVNEDVSWWQVSYVEILMEVVSVTHGQDSNSLSLHLYQYSNTHYRIYVSDITLSKLILQQCKAKK